MVQRQFAYGALPDTYDHRDMIFENFAAARTKEVLPPEFDLRTMCSPVRDQAQLGSCTGFALGPGLREYLEIATGTPKPPIPVSPLFIYYEERAKEGTIALDAGASIRDGLKVLKHMGVCPETDMPYDVAKFTEAPSADAVAAAKALKIQAYHRIQSLQGLKRALVLGFGCVLGIAVYDSFEDPAALATGHVPIPQPVDQRRGGHALFCAGYKDDATYAGGGYVIVKNSWGTEIGDSGYFYLPYAYISNSKLTFDMWAAN